jgi:hypothetical protein
VYLPGLKFNLLPTLPLSETADPLHPVNLAQPQPTAINIFRLPSRRILAEASFPAIHLKSYPSRASFLLAFLVTWLFDHVDPANRRILPSTFISIPRTLREYIHLLGWTRFLACLNLLHRRHVAQAGMDSSHLCGSPTLTRSRKSRSG